MVAKNSEGRSIAVPPLKLETETEKKLFEAAKLRKAMRAEMAERAKAMHVGMTDTN